MLAPGLKQPHPHAYTTPDLQPEGPRINGPRQALPLITIVVADLPRCQVATNCVSQLAKQTPAWKRTSNDSYETTSTFYALTAETKTLHTIACLDAKGYHTQKATSLHYMLQQGTFCETYRAFFSTLGTIPSKVFGN
jgi:hypothetical protein